MRKITHRVVDLDDPEQLAQAAGGLPHGPDVVTFYGDEWRDRRPQCEAILRARAGVFDRELAVQACTVQAVPPAEVVAFLDANYVRGVGCKLLASFGLYEGPSLLGVIAMAIPKGVARNRVTVHRLCFRAGVRVHGGAAALFEHARAWALSLHYDAILATSDNRLTPGTLCEGLGFVRAHDLRPDYFYVKDGRRYPKESQRKCRVGCPGAQTEHEWALARGFVRICDAGKVMWVYHLNPDAIAEENQRNSERVARLHSAGVFKNAHMRGYFRSAKNAGEIYFGSSYELRCLFELEGDAAVQSMRRGDAFQATDGWRSPDFHVTFVDGHEEIWEVKPAAFLDRGEVRAQIGDSLAHATKAGVRFRVWTERDSALGTCNAIIGWAHAYLAEQQGDPTYADRRKDQRKVIRDRQYAKQKAASVTVACAYCGCDHVVLPRTYARNIARNGTYTCEAMAGHKGGSQPKPRKANPHAAAGKKECCRCHAVLAIDAFDVRTRARDGRAPACKACCSTANAARYRARIANTCSLVDKTPDCCSMGAEEGTHGTPE